MENFTERSTPAGLYSPQFEHDNCGIGAVVDIKGRKSHKPLMMHCKSWSTSNTAQARTPRARPATASVS